MGWGNGSDIWAQQLPVKLLFFNNFLLKKMVYAHFYEILLDSEKKLK